MAENYNNGGQNRPPNSNNRQNEISRRNRNVYELDLIDINTKDIEDKIDNIKKYAEQTAKATSKSVQAVVDKDVNLLITKYTNAFKTISKSEELKNYKKQLDYLVSQTSNLSNLGNRSNTSNALNNAVGTGSTAIVASGARTGTFNRSIFNNSVFNNSKFNNSIFNNVTLNVTGGNGNTTNNNGTRSTTESAIDNLGRTRRIRNEDGTVTESYESGVTGLDPKNAASASKMSNIVNSVGQIAKGIGQIYHAVNRFVGQYWSSYKFYQENYSKAGALTDPETAENIFSKSVDNYAEKTATALGVPITAGYKEINTNLMSVLSKGYSEDTSIGLATEFTIADKMMPWLEKQQDSYAHMYTNLGADVMHQYEGQQLLLKRTEEGNRLLNEGIIANLTSEIAPLLTSIDLNTGGINNLSGEYQAIMQQLMEQGMSTSDAYAQIQSIMKSDKDLFSALSSGSVADKMYAINRVQGANAIQAYSGSVGMLGQMAGSTGSDLGASAVARAMGVQGAGGFQTSSTMKQLSIDPSAAQALADQLNSGELTQEAYDEMVDQLAANTTADEAYRNFMENSIDKMLEWMNHFPLTAFGDIGSLIPSLVSGFANLGGGLLNLRSAGMMRAALSGASGEAGSAGGGLLSNLLGGASASGGSGSLVSLSGLKTAGSKVLSSPVAKIGGGVIGGAMTIADAIGGYQKSDEWGTSGVSSTIGGALGGTDSGFSGALSGAAKGAAIGTMFGPWGTAIGGVLGGVTGAIGGENISKALDGIGEGLSAWGTVFEKSPKLFEAGIDMLGDTISDGAGNLADAFSGAVSTIGDFLSNVGGGVLDFFGNVGSAIGDAGGAIGSALGFADGLDYVPSDNFPAYLHKGEAVVNATTAQTLRNNGIYGTDRINELSTTNTTSSIIETVSTEILENLVSTISDILSESKDIQSSILSNMQSDPMKITDSNGNASKTVGGVVKGVALAKA